MPRETNGDYVLPAGNPVYTGTDIEPEWANNTLDDIGVGISNSIPRSGSAPMAANLDMAGFSVVDVSAVTPLTAYSAPSDGVNMQDAEAESELVVVTAMNVHISAANPHQQYALEDGTGNTFRYGITRFASASEVQTPSPSPEYIAVDPIALRKQFGNAVVVARPNYNFVFTAAYIGCYLYWPNAGGTYITLPSSDTDIPIGARFEIAALGYTGGTLIFAPGAGVTLIGDTTFTKWCSKTLIRVAADVYHIIG
jgi:hypothetical protein